MRKGTAGKKLRAKSHMLVLVMEVLLSLHWRVRLNLLKTEVFFSKKLAVYLCAHLHCKNFEEINEVVSIFELSHNLKYLYLSNGC